MNWEGVYGGGVSSHVGTAGLERERAWSRHAERGRNETR